MTDPQSVVIASCVYGVLLLTLGYFGRRAKQRNTLEDHFLAGRSIGLVVLLLTLFATQYSGNSLSGFPGKTYRAGLGYIMSVTFMVGVVSGYLLYAPALLARARKRRYLTPNDFLADRFGSPTLHYTAAAIFAFTLCNFLLAQLMAMGHAFAGLTDGRISYTAGVVGGAAVILGYELLGGMRAVAWTDAIQGSILISGLALVVVVVVTEIGTPTAILQTLAVQAPAKVASPSFQACLTWLSTCALLGLGGPLYPQAIQRLFAARRIGELRSALAIMALVPLFVITTVVFIGITGAMLFPDLDTVGSDQVTFRVLGHLADLQPWVGLPVLLVMMGVLAAIMSTADSALLSLASIFTKDVIARRLGLRGTEVDRLTRVVPAISLGAVLLLGWIALEPRFTLWRLLEIKFEVLIQLSPAFVLGTLPPPSHGRPYAARDVLRGLMVGLTLALGLYLTGHSTIFGLHAGVLGVIANYLTAMASRRLDRRPETV